MYYKSKIYIYSSTSGGFKICIKQFCGSFISFYETVLRKLHLKFKKIFIAATQSQQTYF